MLALGLFKGDYNIRCQICLVVFILFHYILCFAVDNYVRLACIPYGLGSALVSSSPLCYNRTLLISGSEKIATQYFHHPDPFLAFIMHARNGSG